MSNPEVAKPATQLTPGSHSTVFDGVEQAYHVHGGGPICVVHPGGPGADWRYLRVPVLERHLTVVYVEPIGTGTSGCMPQPSDYTLDRYAQHLNQLIDHLDSGPVHVLGHSHGGFVALGLAVAHPETVAGIVLFDTAARAGQDWMTEAMAQVTRFAETHSERPDLADISPRSKRKQPRSLTKSSRASSVANCRSTSPTTGVANGSSRRCVTPPRCTRGRTRVTR